MTDISSSSADPGRPRTVQSQIAFPRPVYINGRSLFWRSEIEAHKAALAGIPPRPFEGPDELVPMKKFAVELGCHPRTLVRRVLEAEKAATGESRPVSPLAGATEAARAARRTPAEAAERAAVHARARAARLAQAAKRAAQAAAEAEAAAKAARAGTPADSQKAAAADEAAAKRDAARRAAV
jgi:hypothetical protein